VTTTVAEGQSMSAEPSTPEPQARRLVDLLTGAVPFALLRRSDHEVEVLTGPVAELSALSDLDSLAREREAVVMVPFRQIAERGFACHDDGTPLSALVAEQRFRVPVSDVLDSLPDDPFTVRDLDFDLDDQAYGDIVRRVLRDEIGRGEGANFVIRRTITGAITGDALRAGLAVFRRLLIGEVGAYWTFLVHTGTRLLIGASPERHARLDTGKVLMNPISGTYRYPEAGPSPAGVRAFLRDAKEVDELHMVVDEELKMMARMCGPGVRVDGPYLKPMARLAHTEYVLSGATGLGVPEVLRETMFVPTVTGSPLENACRVITRHEQTGRGYYSGILALVDRDDHDRPRMDSVVMIRTIDLRMDGSVSTSVGATLVRHSTPDGEAAETRAKSRMLVEALRGHVSPAPRRSFNAVEARDLLSARTGSLARFWLDPVAPVQSRPLAGLPVLLIDGADTFTAMLAQQLRAIGTTATIRRYDEEFDLDDHPFVVVGPGPGDPDDPTLPSVSALDAVITRMLAIRKPFVAVCLGHQVLSARLGLPLRRRTAPNQGKQQAIDLFGRPARVGFYNTFAAICAADQFTHNGRAVQVSRDTVTSEVHALRSDRFASFQFHPESILTLNGPELLAETLERLVTRTHATL
jgi:phenazine biosynthesis protein phzE